MINKKERILTISLLFFVYLIINAIIYYINIINNKNNIDINFHHLSITSSIILVTFISLVTILVVILPKVFYFFIIRFIFNISNIDKKNIFLFVLLGYIPIFLNTLVVNILDFYTNINEFWRSEKDYTIFGLFHFYDIIDTFSVVLISLLITKKIKGTYRDFTLMVFGWLILRIIFFILNEAV